MALGQRGPKSDEPVNLTPACDALHRHPEYREIFAVGAALDEHMRASA